MTDQTGTKLLENPRVRIAAVIVVLFVLGIGTVTVRSGGSNGSGGSGTHPQAASSGGSSSPNGATSAGNGATSAGSEARSGTGGTVAPSTGSGPALNAASLASLENQPLPNTGSSFHSWPAGLALIILGVVMLFVLRRSEVVRRKAEAAKPDGEVWLEGQVPAQAHVKAEADEVPELVTTSR